MVYSSSHTCKSAQVSPKVNNALETTGSRGCPALHGCMVRAACTAVPVPRPRPLRPLSPTPPPPEHLCHHTSSLRASRRPRPAAAAAAGAAAGLFLWRLVDVGAVVDGRGRVEVDDVRSPRARRMFFYTALHQRSRERVIRADTAPASIEERRAGHDTGSCVSPAGARVTDVNGTTLYGTTCEWGYNAKQDVHCACRETEVTRGYFFSVVVTSTSALIPNKDILPNKDKSM